MGGHLAGVLDEGYLAGVPSRLHGPHILIQLLAELLQLLLQQHLHRQDGAATGKAGTARTPHPSTGTLIAAPIPTPRKMPSSNLTSMG